MTKVSSLCSISKAFKNTPIHFVVIVSSFKNIFSLIYIYLKLAYIFGTVIFDL